MAIRTEIGIKVTRKQVDILYNAYVYDHGRKAKTELQYLLLSHAGDMHWRLEVMGYRKFTTTTIRLTEPEAIAFCLYWSEANLEYDQLAKVTILSFIGQIQKQVQKKIHADPTL